MTIIVNPFKAMEERRAEIDRHARNSAGEVSVSALLQTTGFGEFTTDVATRFGFTFLDLPAVSHCAVLSSGTLVAKRFPISSPLVADWDLDERGFYMAAYLAVTVLPSFPYLSATSEPSYTLTHTFTFTGLAIRDVPQAVLGDF